VFAGAALAGMAVLTALPGVLRAVHVPGPKWLVPTVLALTAAVVAFLKPTVVVFSQRLAGRARARSEEGERAEAALAALPGRGGRPPLVREVTSRAVLGIHEAIPLPAGAAAEGLSQELPEYVARDIDADLRPYLTARAVSGGGFALLVGPAAAGKTRTAYEALRQTLPDWHLLMPATGAEVNELAGSGAVPPRSVIWLNETQDFLTGTDQLTAASVRRLLTDTARPVILIGTIWPDRYDQLRTAGPPAAPSGGDGRPADRHRQADEPAPSSPAWDSASVRSPEATAPIGADARALLEQSRTFRLRGFTPGEWDRADDLAARDPRLREAAHHRDSGLTLTQILSAAPELIHRWEQADNPYGQAVITAAVTARRCGHPDTIPTTVLEPLTAQILTGTHRATAPADWFTTALAWACVPVHHTAGIAPLRPHGETIGQTDGYRVTDILTNHTTPTSPAPPLAHVPPAQWDTLITTADTGAAFIIGLVAYVSALPTQATRAWTRAADAGNTDAMNNFGNLHNQAGETSIARTWYERAANAGNPHAMNNFGVLLAQAGDTDAARTWFERAADAGNTDAMNSLGVLLAQAGDTDVARTWWTRSADAGNTGAMFNLGVLHLNAGDTETARTWWTRAAASGSADAAELLARLGGKE
jgi:Flp pilus assembly protein TadD